MEAVKYILDFFFGPGNFWHFLGLCVVCLCLSPKSSIQTIIQRIRKEDNHE